jgi:Cu+-exporting ATPase
MRPLLLALVALAAVPLGDASQYTCPMHPEVVSDAPGKCSKCGMALVPKTPKKKEQAAR